MTEVEHVAVWVGLILAVAGIALAMVSMLFTWVVNKRAETLNDQTVKALTRLETDMERVSDDVRGLIRDAWARLVIGAPSEEATSGTNGESATPPVPVPKVETKPAQPPVARPDPYATTVDAVRRSSPAAQWLLRTLHEKGGLPYMQYVKLRRTPLGPALFELSQSRLATIYTIPGVEEDRVVFGVLASQVDAVRIALSLLDEPSKSVKDAVAKELAVVEAGAATPAAPAAPPAAAPAASPTVAAEAPPASVPPADKT